jgi:8-oxo-dGTP diphosphatase
VAHVEGHQAIYGGDEGLRHHLCTSHGEHMDEGASREEMEERHEGEHDWSPAHRGEYSCPDGEHDELHEPTELTDMHDRDAIGEIHRGIGVALPDELHRMVHDPSRPLHERARALLEHVSDHPEGNGHLGTHWTTENSVAEDFAETAARWKRDEDDRDRPADDRSFGHYTEDDEDEGPQHHRLPRPGTAVVFHAHPPPAEAIDRSPHRWGNGDVYGYSEHGEREVPIASSHDLSLRGISWAQVHSEDDPDESHWWPEYEHHDFGSHEPREAARSEVPFTVAPERDLPRDFLDLYDDGRDDEMPSSVRNIPIEKIRWSHQSTLDRATLQEYKRTHGEGGDFLPEALQVGEHYHLNEGHHRTQARHDLGRKTIQARVFHEPPGGWDYEDAHEPREAAAQPQQAWYYGTTGEHAPGDQVEHYYWRKYPERPDFREHSPLYTTTDPSLAAHIADLRERQSHGSATGHLYEVRPTGPLRPDEMANPLVRGNASWQTSHPLHVVREVPREEWPQDLNAWHRPDDEVDEARRTREASLVVHSRMPAPDYDPSEELPEGRGIFYRSHDMRYPLDEAHARSAPLNHGYRPFQVSPTFSVGQRGYSSFASPHRLSSYMDEMEWKDNPSWPHRDVIAFHGKQVGVGEDNEPLVVPEANPHCCGRVIHSRMPWDEFEGKLWHGDYADPESHKYHNDQELWREQNQDHELSERRLRHQYWQAPEVRSERRHREKVERREASLAQGTELLGHFEADAQDKHPSGRDWFYGEQPAHAADLPGEMHRGIPFRLSPEVHAVVHDDSRPVGERARALMQHLDDWQSRQAKYGGAGLGIHWSVNPSTARNFATKYDTRNHSPYDFVHDPESTQVVLHARTAEPGQMIRGERTMREHDIFGVNHGEGEIPLRKRSRVALTGISWSRNEKDAPLTRHDFPVPLNRSAGSYVAPAPEEDGYYGEAAQHTAAVQGADELLGHFEAAERPWGIESAQNGGGEPWTFYHGTPDARSWDKGSTYGIHVGTYEAARQALEARIGAPAEGEWDGTREYGSTPIVSNAKNMGYGTGLSARGEPRHEEATYSDGSPVPHDARPSVFPVHIVGPMTNHPAAPMDDAQANGRMRGQITRGTARRGYYYRNSGEDSGSVSAVVPSAAHLLPAGDQQHTAAARPGRGEKTCKCCKGSGSHGDGSACGTCEGSGFTAGGQDEYCDGQPRPRRRHWRQGAADGGLEALRRRGYCTDDWDRWQQGNCGTYAAALVRAHPHLSFGVAGYSDDDGWSPAHFFAHDDTHAYDSAGKHPLPYRGVHGDMDIQELGHAPEDWGMPEEEGAGDQEVSAAQEHARRNRIVEGGFGAVTASIPAATAAVNGGMGNIPAAERAESVRHMLDHYKPSDFGTWAEVRDNYNWDHPGMQEFVDHVRQHGVLRPVPVDYEQDPPQVMNGHTRLLAAERAGVETVPTRQHEHYFDPDDPDHMGHQEGGRLLEGLQAALEAPAPAGDEPSDDHKEIRAEAAGEYRIQHTAPGPHAGHLPLHHYTGQDPDTPVRIYRSAPAGTEAINTGDWISLSADYAHRHGRHATDSSRDWPVYTAEVPGKHVHWDENDEDEHGYNGPDIRHPDVHDEETGQLHDWHDWHEEHPHGQEAWAGGAVHLPQAEHDFVHDEFEWEPDRADTVLNAAREQGALRHSRWHDDLYPAREEAEEHASSITPPEGHRLTTFTVHRTDDGKAGDIAVHPYRHDDDDLRRYQNMDMEGHDYEHPAIDQVGKGGPRQAALSRAIEFRDEFRGSHGGHVSWSGSRVPHEQYGTWHAHDAATGEHLGRLDYSVTEPGDADREAHVQEIKTDEGHQGEGVASALMDHLYAQHPEPAAIRHGYRTDEGAVWWERYVAARPHIAEREQRQDARDEGEEDEPPVSSGPWYHGTNEEFGEGDRVRPAAEVGRQTRGGAGDEHRVWVSSDPYRAGAYGAHVYEVQPGMTPRHTRGPADEHETDSAHVVRKLTYEEQRQLSPSYQESARAYERQREAALEVTAAPEDYGISHRPDEDGPPLHDMLEGGMMPSDFYDKMHQYNPYAGSGDTESEDAAYKSMSMIRRTRGQPDKKVVIWRSAPAVNPESRNGKRGEINHGDWVGLSRAKALQESRESNDPPGGSLHPDDGRRYHIWSATVPARHVRNAGGDVTEWGYFGPDIKDIPHVSGYCDHRARVTPRQEVPEYQLRARQRKGDAPREAALELVAHFGEDPAGVTVEHQERPSGGATYPHMHVLTATHPDGTTAELRYMLSRRNGKGVVDHSFIPGGYAESLGRPLVQEARRLHPGTFVKGLPGIDEDWGQHLPSVTSLHRHLTVRLEPADRDYVHDESVPRAHRAAHLMSLMEQGGPSMHWASQRGRAAAEKFGDHDFRGPEHTQVALSAQPPAPEHVETDPERISRNGGYAYQPPDWEVPVREGAPLTVTSIRWRTGDGGWTRHQFRGGYQFTAGRSAAHEAAITWDDLGRHLEDWFHPQQLSASTYPHPKTGYSIETGLEHHTAQPEKGEGPAEFRVTDYGPPGAGMMHRFEHPQPNKPIEHVYRGVSSEEWRQARERGYLRSDQRGTIADWEGTNAATDPRSAVSYLPATGTGHVLKIRVHPDEKWFTIPHDDYVRTREQIPLERVEAVSPEIEKGGKYGGVVTRIGDKEASLALEAAVQGPLENPHTHGNEWYHGSPYRFGSFSGDQPYSPLHYDYADDDGSHWNTLLGHHFAASHGSAEEFSRGEHSPAPDGVYDDETPQENVIHARLGIRNPKVYKSDMDQEAYEHEWKAGNHHDRYHDPELTGTWEDGSEFRDDERPATYQYAGHGDRMRSRDESDPVYRHLFRTHHPYATGWLNSHPDKAGIADRFRQRLIGQGHDGVVYGNEFEGSQIGKGDSHHMAAVPFSERQIDITQRHTGPDCIAPEHAARQWPGGHREMSPLFDEEGHPHEVVAHFAAAGPVQQLKLFHMQREPGQYDPESRRTTPSDPAWRYHNDPDNYEPDECEHCGGDQNFPEEHSDTHHHWLTSQDWYTDWDEAHPGDTIHRGVGLDLPDHVHQVVHDESRPVHERAHALLSHMLSDENAGGNGLGNFWSSDSGVSKVYAESAAQRYGRQNRQTPVIIHAHTPAMEHIETDPEQLQHWGVYSYHLAGNREVPLTHGAPVRIKGISWAPPGHQRDAGTRDEPPRLADDDAWAHHEVGGEGIRATASGALSSDHAEAQLREIELVAHFEPEGHTAALAALPFAREGDDGNFDHPEYGYYDEDAGYRHPQHGWHCPACDKFHDDPETVRDHDTVHTDWDREYPRLPAEMHRGMLLDGVPGIGHEGQSPHEAAQAILGHAGDFGMHWTPSESQARHYAVTGSGHLGGGGWNVVVHARKPERDHIETDPDTLAEHRVFGMDYHEDEEIPVREGAPVHVTGVSWKRDSDPDDAWQRHSFDQPAEHTATLEASRAPSCRYCGDPLDDEDIRDGASAHEECSDMRWCQPHQEHHDDPSEAEDHNETYTDWGGILPFEHGIHRGITVRLPQDVHSAVHSESRPPAERAAILGRHLSQEPLGVHWTDHEPVAQAWGSGQGSVFGIPEQERSDPSWTHVVMHAASPDDDHIETDPAELSRRNLAGYDQHAEREVPLRKGAPVTLTGLSWKRADQPEWQRHEVAPLTGHTASLEATSAMEPAHEDMDAQQMRRHMRDLHGFIDSPDDPDWLVEETHQGEHADAPLEHSHRDLESDPGWDEEVGKNLGDKDFLHQHGIEAALEPVVAHFEEDDYDEDADGEDDGYEERQAAEEAARRAELPYMEPPREGELRDHMHHLHGMDSQVSDLHMSPKNQERWHDQEHLHRTDMTHQHETPRGLAGERQWPAVFQLSEHTDFFGGTPRSPSSFERVLHDPEASRPFQPLAPSESSLHLPVARVHGRDVTPAVAAMHLILHHGREATGMPADPVAAHDASHREDDWLGHAASDEMDEHGIVHRDGPPPEEGSDYSVSGEASRRRPLPEGEPIDPVFGSRQAAAASETDDYEDPGKVYLRFGRWPEDERSMNHAMGWKEEGVSAYDMNRRGEPMDPDPTGSARHHVHDESCDQDCDNDWMNENYGETHPGDRVRRAERARYNGRDNDSDTGHLVKGDFFGFGHDAEPLLRNVRRVGDWIDHRHLFIPGAEPHRLARDPSDEDYEPPEEAPVHRTAALEATAAYDWETDEGPFTWDEIAARHPDSYGENDENGYDGPDIADAAAELYHDRPSHPYSETGGELNPAWGGEMEFHPRTVDPRRIDYISADPGDQRVRRARQGYEGQRPENVPPLILVHRHGVYNVADGHHRAKAAFQAGKPVRAYVAYSPHDEPFAGRYGDPPERAPLHGAELEDREPYPDQNGIRRRISYPGFPHAAEAGMPHTAALEEPVVQHFAAAGFMDGEEHEIPPYAGQQLYHGTRSSLEPGEMLTPDEAVRHQSHPDEDSIGYVHATPHYEEAAYWGEHGDAHRAHQRMTEMGRGREIPKHYGPHHVYHPRVYEVHPAGAMEPDPNGEGQSYRSASPLRVVREVWPAWCPDCKEEHNPGHPHYDLLHEQREEDDPEREEAADVEPEPETEEAAPAAMAPVPPEVTAEADDMEAHLRGAHGYTDADIGTAAGQAMNDMGRRNSLVTSHKGDHASEGFEHWEQHPHPPLAPRGGRADGGPPSPRPDAIKAIMAEHRWRNSRQAALEPAVAYSGDGDGYTTCDQGHTHWGTNGAAGLLVRHHGDDGQVRYLLQHRSPHVQHGDTWSTPGGAIRGGETPEHAAHREATEELGELPGDLVHHHTFTDDHGGWAYHTVVVDSPRQFHPEGGDEDWEHAGHGWFTPHEMDELPLHPGFRSSWGAVRKSGALEASGAGSLPVEDGLYYRTHHKDAPFGPEHASTRNIGEPPSPEMAKYWEPKSGYSAFWSPHHLSQYHDEMGWSGDMQDRRVLAFRGTPVGEGADGEPRVMPHGDKPESSMSWRQFQKRLEVTPEEPTRWDQHTWGEGPSGQMVDDGYRTIAALQPGPDQRSAREERGDRWHEFGNRYSDDLHRGIHVELPGPLHSYVHDESVPREDRARALEQHLAESGQGLGMHWTPHLSIANRSIHNALDDEDREMEHDPDDEHGYDPDNRKTFVMLHIQRPGERNRLRNPEELRRHEVGWAYSPDEDEFPVKPGSPLRLTGISWKQHEPDYPMEPFEHVDFRKPVRHVSSVQPPRSLAAVPSRLVIASSVSDTVAARPAPLAGASGALAAVASWTPATATEAREGLQDFPVLFEALRDALEALAGHLDECPVSEAVPDIIRKMATACLSAAEDARQVAAMPLGDPAEGTWTPPKA